MNGYQRAKKGRALGLKMGNITEKEEHQSLYNYVNTECGTPQWRSPVDNWISGLKLNQEIRTGDKYLGVIGV